jgi:hypothetical protein
MVGALDRLLDLSADRHRLADADDLEQRRHAAR